MCAHLLYFSDHMQAESTARLCIACRSTSPTAHRCIRFVACVQVGSIVNFALMYLLAPTAAAAGGAVGQSLVVRALSEEFLVKWGAPGGNMFQPGFPISKRLVNFVYKGTIFAIIGMMAGTVGTSISNGLLHVRWVFLQVRMRAGTCGSAACCRSRPVKLCVRSRCELQGWT